MSLVLQSIFPYPDSCLGTSPHQQGWDTKMEKLSCGGIDVSKDRLDVVVLPEGWFFSVSNDTAGHAAAPPRTVMNSRRRMGRSVRAKRVCEYYQTLPQKVCDQSHSMRLAATLVRLVASAFRAPLRRY